MSTDIATLPAGLADMISTKRPEGNDEGVLGSEHIGKDDIIIPRLALAQKTSPELDPTAPRYIEGLQFTDLFNSLSKKTYGRGPLYFSILRADKPRYVEFNPLDQGGGVKDPNVPPDDPRTQFGPPDPTTGQSAKPLATKFYDFIILLLNELDMDDPLKNVMGLSMKSTALKVARQLNLYITQRGKKALYKGAYKVSTTSDKNALGSFAVFKVDNAGWLTKDSPVEALAAEMFESWKEKAVVIDVETDHPDAEKEDPTSFNPSEYEDNRRFEEQRRGAGVPDM